MLGAHALNARIPHQYVSMELGTLVWYAGLATNLTINP